MNISGRTMIFKSEYGYSTSISSKNKDGNYDRMYVSVQFPKDIELENKTFIDIEDGFLSFYKDKNGMAKLKIVVMKFIEEEKTKDAGMGAEIGDGEDLPF